MGGKRWAIESGTQLMIQITVVQEYFVGPGGILLRLDTIAGRIYLRKV